MNVCLDLTQIVVAIISIAGASSFLTFRITKKHIVNQNRNTVTGGDIVGGNKTV